MSDDVLLVEVEDGIAVVTLNRPQARNALNGALRAAIPRTMIELDQRDDVHAIVLTGADPAFCAGLDLKELGSGENALGASGTGADGGERPPKSTSAKPHRPGPFPTIDTLVIGAVNGVAITGGFELALACDFLVASERARFADTHARVGIMPGWGLTVLLPEAIGLRRAKEMSTTGNFIDAETALRWGLVNHVVPHDELLPFAKRLAADSITVPRVAQHRMLQTYEEGARRDGAGRWALEAEVAKAWQGRGIDPAEIEARRKDVMARGRTQV